MKAAIIEDESIISDVIRDLASCFFQEKGKEILLYQYSTGHELLRDLEDESLASIRKKIDEDKVRKTMELVGLDPASKKWVSKYSLGMRQRLIAQAIMEDQDLPILDEPMNGLDKQGAADVRELLLRMKEEGKTILLASHNAQDIEILCDKVYEVDGGKVTEMKKTAGAKSLIEVRSVTKRYGTKKRIQLLAEWINKNEKKYLNN